MTQAAEGLLSVRGLVKDFGGLRAVDGLDLELGSGELLVLVGPNGCGKTTFFNLLSGALKPSAGEIRFAGQPIGGLPPYRAARLGIVRKFQVPSVYPSLSVAENLRIPLCARRGQRGFLGLLREAAETREGIEDLLGEVRLWDKRGDAAGSLSHGEKQWLEIALVLASRPRLMLLDEPTAGMTFAEAEATVDLIARLHRQRGIAAIVIEHDMAVVERLDCPVAAMIKGTIIARGPFAAVRDDPQVRAHYLGTAA